MYNTFVVLKMLAIVSSLGSLSNILFSLGGALAATAAGFNNAKQRIAGVVSVQ